MTDRMIIGIILLLCVPGIRSIIEAARGRYCGYIVKADGSVLEVWPPVFSQGQGYQ